jgi:hypothetical protein
MASWVIFQGRRWGRPPLPGAAIEGWKLDATGHNTIDVTPSVRVYGVLHCVRFDKAVFNRG